MDARDKYAYMTGDYNNAYKLLESDQEGFFYTDKMMEKAVSLLESAKDTGEQTYFQTLMEKNGPHKGALFANSYALSPMYGRENFMNINDKNIGKMQKLYQGAQFLTNKGVYPSAKMGFMQGLLDYMVDRYNEY
jgi:hypothetical protein